MNNMETFLLWKSSWPPKPTNWFLKGLSERWWQEQITLSVFMNSTKTNIVTSVSLCISAFEVGLEWTCSYEDSWVWSSLQCVLCWMQSEGSVQITHPPQTSQWQTAFTTTAKTTCMLTIITRGSGFSWLASLLLVDVITTSLCGQNSIFFYWWPLQKIVVHCEQIIYLFISEHHIKNK